MKISNPQQLFNEFEKLVQYTEKGVEFWFARDLSKLLEYSRYGKFYPVVQRAMTAVTGTGDDIDDHFIDCDRPIERGKGAKVEQEDVMLSRYAAYMVAQSGDSQKERVAFAQSYFAVKTRKLELIEERVQQVHRLRTRAKLRASESNLSDLIFERTGANFAYIRSMGNKALFHYTTQEMKDRLGVPKGRALADFLHPVLLGGKAFATEITAYNIKANGINSVSGMTEEHQKNNANVRDMLLKNNIVPESLPPATDVRKVERSVNIRLRQGFKDKKTLK